MDSLARCPTRWLMAAVSSMALMSAALLTAEASLTVHFMSAVKQFSSDHEGLLDVFSWQGPDFHRSLPVELMEKHRSMRTGKEPTRWPDVFHAKIHVKTPVSDEGPVVHSYYDYPNLRLMSVVIPPIPSGVVSKLIRDSERRPENYGLSMKRTIKAFQQQDSRTGLVDTLDGNLFFPDTAIWALMEPYKIAIFSRSAPACEIRPAPKHIVPPPDVMSGASYMGQEVVDGVNCDVYAKGSGPAPFDNVPFVTLYESTETGYPLKFALFNKMEFVFKAFEPNGTLDKEDWELPDSCDSEMGPTSRFPFSVDQ